MGDASGTYASPTGSGLPNGGAGQRQGNEEVFHNKSFQLDTAEQNFGQNSCERRGAGIGTMATHAGGAGTPITAQQESQAPTTDPLVQPLLTRVRLFERKIGHNLGSTLPITNDIAPYNDQNGSSGQVGNGLYLPKLPQSRN